MRYTHWWACHPTETSYARVWPGILADTTRILTRAAGLGITICGPDGHGHPLLGPAGIALGGDAANGLHKQPLRLPAPHRNPYPSPCATPPPASGCVDTGRHPYDSVVAAVLLRCHMLLGGTNFGLRSDGGWDIEWALGARHGQIGARTLVGDLFGAPPSSPLSWPPHPAPPTDRSRATDPANHHRFQGGIQC